MRKNKIYTKTAFACLVCAAFFTSCIDDDSVNPAPECAITAFSISDIKSTIHTQGYDGSDSTFTRTLSGSSVNFNIDQIGGRIYNIDSLPNWVDVTHVIPSITTYGQIYRKNEADQLYYYVTSGEDSIDFTNPVEMMSIGTDGVSYKKYTVTISKSIADADSLVWSLADSTLSLSGDFRLLATNDTVQVFQASDDVDYRSVQVFNNQFVGIDANGHIKTSGDGVTWTETTLPKVKSLLSADPYYLYALTDTAIVSTKDMATWQAAGSTNLDKVPVNNVSSVYYSSKTNDHQKNVILVGQTPNDTTHSVTWYKLSANLDIVNQDWLYIGITEENEYALPYFKNMSNAYYYNGAINIIGDGHLYLSHDNGITWKCQTRFLMVPKGFDNTLPVQCAVSQDYIYLVQSGTDSHRGRMWKGYINKLNPSK